MAYVRKKKTYVLEWAEGPLAGLEVRVASLPLGKFLEVVPDLQAVTEGGTELTPEVAARFSDLIDALAGALLGWNIEDEDADGNRVPVPADRDGLLALDQGEIAAILTAWIDAGVKVDAPLGQPSTPGGGEASGSTEEWLASLPSSPAPS